MCCIARPVHFSLENLLRTRNKTKIRVAGRNKMVADNGKKTKIYRFWMMGALLFSCVGLEYYFHIVHGITVVYAHLFYVPIVIVALWWGLKAGFPVSLFFGLMHIALSFPDIEESVLFRSLALVLVGSAIGIISDMHKRAEEVLRKSEERYRTVVEDMPAMICRFLPDGTLTFVNDAYCRYFNKKKEELIKQNFLQFIPEEDHEEVKNRFMSLTMQEPVITYEHQVVVTDGDIYWQQWTDRALFDLQDNLVGYQSIGQDVTERKRAEEELEVHREHLKLINQILRHDILNDLTAVKSALRLYESSNDEEFLKEASRYVDRGAGTIKRMRELESIISSHKDLEFYDVKDVIKKVIENYQSIKFTIEGKGQVLANGAIDSVIDNIISNAVIHGKTDRIDITIDKQKDLCEVRIADYGIGLPDEMKDEIFEEDFKYGETGRTGLGLHIVKKAMENYGGSVYIEDNTPQGAVFVLRLKRLR